MKKHVLSAVLAVACTLAVYFGAVAFGIEVHFAVLTVYAALGLAFALAWGFDFVTGDIGIPAITAVFVAGLVAGLVTDFFFAAVGFAAYIFIPPAVACAVAIIAMAVAEEKKAVIVYLVEVAIIAAPIYLHLHGE